MERAVYMASGTEVTLKELPEVIAGRESERMQKSAEERPVRQRGKKPLWKPRCGPAAAALPTL